jgi:hypothetical protein
MAIDKVQFQNDRDCPIQIFIEPIANDYTLLPGETVTLLLSPPSPEDQLLISYQDRLIVIWENSGGCGWVTVMKGDKELEYGYQREEWERYHREHNLPYTK